MADPLPGDPDLEVRVLELFVDRIKFFDSGIIDGDCGGEGLVGPVALTEEGAVISGGVDSPSVPAVCVGWDFNSLGSRCWGVDAFPEPNLEIISSPNPHHPSLHR